MHFSGSTGMARVVFGCLVEPRADVNGSKRHTSTGGGAPERYFFGVAPVADAAAGWAAGASFDAKAGPDFT